MHTGKKKKKERNEELNLVTHKTSSSCDSLRCFLFLLMRLAQWRGGILDCCIPAKLFRVLNISEMSWLNSPLHVMTQQVSWPFRKMLLFWLFSRSAVDHCLYLHTMLTAAHEVKTPPDQILLKFLTQLCIPWFLIDWKASWLLCRKVVPDHRAPPLSFTAELRFLQRFQGKRFVDT